jgi:crotonobetainyl-CoA:carnitine CoA-transferase CaiB-like acyl-CoA transferase
MLAELDGYLGPGISVKLDRTPGSVRVAPPAIGAHSSEVIVWFGLDGDRIESLI